MQLKSVSTIMPLSAAGQAEANFGISLYSL
jgi:hypothetical protein